MILKVLKRQSETKNVSSLILEKPTGFRFYAGQYLDIELKTLDPFKVRAFTISSSPTEDFLMISPKKGISLFKKDLYKLKAGDEIRSSYPAGTFILDEKEQAIFITGGVGITPSRSIIKYAVDQKLKTPITLIYSNSDSDFIFKKELDQWAKIYPKLTIHYVITGKEGRLTTEKMKIFLDSRLLTLDSIYYLAGPPSMVDDFENILLELGVDSVNIRTDRFDGY